MAKNSFVAEVTFKAFTNFTGKHLCWCLFLIKLQALETPFFIEYLRGLILIREQKFVMRLHSNKYFFEHWLFPKKLYLKKI